MAPGAPLSVLLILVTLGCPVAQAAVPLLIEGGFTAGTTTCADPTSPVELSLVLDTSAAGDVLSFASGIYCVLAVPGAPPGPTPAIVFSAVDCVGGCDVSPGLSTLTASVDVAPYRAVGSTYELFACHISSSTTPTGLVPDYVTSTFSGSGFGDPADDVFCTDLVAVTAPPVLLDAGFSDGTVVTGCADTADTVELTLVIETSGTDALDFVAGIYCFIGLPAVPGPAPGSTPVVFDATGCVGACDTATGVSTLSAAVTGPPLRDAGTSYSLFACHVNTDTFPTGASPDFVSALFGGAGFGDVTDDDFSNCAAAPAVDCDFTWTPWDGCDAPCDGTGTESRIAVITTPASGGGAPCPDPAVEVRSCSGAPCPVAPATLLEGGFTAGTTSCVEGSETLEVSLVLKTAGSELLDFTAGIFCFLGEPGVPSPVAGVPPVGFDVVDCAGGCDVTPGTSTLTKAVTGSPLRDAGSAYVLFACHVSSTSFPTGATPEHVNSAYGGSGFGVAGDDGFSNCAALVVDCAGSWSAWGACDAPCDGTGTETRTFTATTPPSGGGSACPASPESRPCSGDPCPAADVDCAGSWSAWGACDAPCDGVGSETRTFTVTTPPSGAGAACPASPESRPCSGDPCVPVADVDCAGSWSAWGVCDAPCDGTGSETRTFTVTTPPSGAGAACPASPESRSCSGDPCPAVDVDCAGSWSAWGACDAPCGASGSETRSFTVTTPATGAGAACPSSPETRSCTSAACTDPDLCHLCIAPSAGPCTSVAGICYSYSFAATSTCPPGTSRCADGPAVTDCIMNPWTAWTSCDASCGGGTRSRSRTVEWPPYNGGAPCPHDYEEEACNEHACPPPPPGPDVDCVQSDWSAFTACSHTCGGGTQFRTRSVVVPQAGAGAACGPASETRACNEDPCASTGCGGCWGGSSGECQGANTVCYGYYTGTNLCPGGTSACAAPPSPPPSLPAYEWSEWGAWGACTGACDTGSRTATRTCVCNHAECDVSTLPCAGSDSRSGICLLPPCVGALPPYSWSEWADGPCVGACGTGVNTRTRACVCDAAECDAATLPCAGSAIVDEACDTGSVCPVQDCEVSEWSDYGPCDCPCGGGVMRRTRTILVQNGIGGALCPVLEEDAPCNTQPCPSACPHGACWPGTSGPCQAYNGVCFDYLNGPSATCPAGTDECTGVGGHSVNGQAAGTLSVADVGTVITHENEVAIKEQLAIEVGLTPNHVDITGVTRNADGSTDIDFVIYTPESGDVSATQAAAALQRASASGELGERLHSVGFSSDGAATATLSVESDPSATLRGPETFDGQQREDEGAVGGSDGEQRNSKVAMIAVGAGVVGIAVVAAAVGVRRRRRQLGLKRVGSTPVMDVHIAAGVELRRPASWKAPRAAIADDELADVVDEVRMPGHVGE